MIRVAQEPVRSAVGISGAAEGPSCDPGNGPARQGGRTRRRRRFPALQPERHRYGCAGAAPRVRGRHGPDFGCRIPPDAPDAIRRGGAPLEGLPCAHLAGARERHSRLPSRKRRPVRFSFPVPRCPHSGERSAVCVPLSGVARHPHGDPLEAGCHPLPRLADIADRHRPQMAQALPDRVPQTGDGPDHP